MQGKVSEKERNKENEIGEKKLTLTQGGRVEKGGGGLPTLGILAVVFLSWLYVQPIENEDPLRADN